MVVRPKIVILPVRLVRSPDGTGTCLHQLQSTCRDPSSTPHCTQQALTLLLSLHAESALQYRPIHWCCTVVRHHSFVPRHIRRHTHMSPRSALSTSHGSRSRARCIGNRLSTHGLLSFACRSRFQGGQGELHCVRGVLSSQCWSDRVRLILWHC